MGKSSKDKALQELKVSEPSSLLDFLLASDVKKSRSAVKSLLSHKQVLINGKIVTAFDFELKRNDRISIMRYDQSRKEKKLSGMKIVFEDEHIIVIDKEPGVLSVSTEKEKFKTIYNVLNEYVKKKHKNGKVFVLHRMDRELSGLMVFAKSEEVQGLFQRNWNLIVLSYNYMGVIEGVLAKEKGTLKSWLTENKNFQVFSSAKDNGGMEAITHYEIIKSNEQYSLVHFVLATRRKNQIRAQMQQMQCPIVGDKKYGAKDSPIKRVALHAESMEIKHPITGDRIELKSSVSRPMMHLVNPRQPTFKE